MTELEEKIRFWKEKRNAAILAHYYTLPQVQALADYIGDSFYLSKMAASLPEQTLLFCGVAFMGESAKLMNPEKTVLLPAPDADCPMAHMTSPEEVRAFRESYEDLAVVCYINSDSSLKACADVCVTSANALQLVRALPQKRILLIPDQNLGRFLARQIPEKEFLFCSGFCPVHVALTAEMIHAAQKRWPEAPVLMHPECTPETLETADFIGSTAGIIRFAAASEKNDFIIATEVGVLTELTRQCPEKRFHPAAETLLCPAMKKITPENMLASLEHNTFQIPLPPNAKDARRSLEKMIILSEAQTK